MRPQFFLTLAGLVVMLAQQATAQGPPPSPYDSESLPLPRTANAPITGGAPQGPDSLADPAGATAAPSLSNPNPASAPQPPGAESWRYVQRGGVWWYYQQNNQWAYLSNGRWVSYNQSGSNAPPSNGMPPNGGPPSSGPSVSSAPTNSARPLAERPTAPRPAACPWRAARRIMLLRRHILRRSMVGLLTATPAITGRPIPTAIIRGRPSASGLVMVTAATVVARQSESAFINLLIRF